MAPWRKPDGRIGRPTGKTKVAAVASRDRHIAAAEETARCAPLAEGFTTQSTLAELSRWWLDNVARHRVRVTTFATYEKQLRLIGGKLGDVPVRKLRPEQVAAFISDLADRRPCAPPAASSSARPYSSFSSAGVDSRPRIVRRSEPPGQW